MSAWMKFYPSDWRADPALRSCSIAARGLWMEMICIMHEANPRGSLLINGRPVDDLQLSKLAGISQINAKKLLNELENAGVFSRDESGEIFSRRIRRDDEKAKKDKENGGKGGNPLLKCPDKQGVNPPVNGEDKAQKPEARSQIPEDILPAQQQTAARAAPSPPPDEPPSETRLRLDRLTVKLCAAIGPGAPASIVIGPMLPLVDAFGEKRVLDALASEARRPRRAQIRTWALWADIVAEALNAAPKIAPPDPGDEMIEYEVMRSMKASSLEYAVKLYAEKGTWMSQWGRTPDKNPRLQKFAAERGIDLRAKEPA